MVVVKKYHYIRDPTCQIFKKHSLYCLTEPATEPTMCSMKPASGGERFQQTSIGWRAGGIQDGGFRERGSYSFCLKRNGADIQFRQ